jgi:hypothetical protein|tara:strand:+ start:37 stop:1350 length:1314 start_codon:yes stop_codon:yes gene_type:complete
MTSKAFELAQLGDAVTVDSSGNLGLGTSSPTAILDVRRGDASGKIAEFHTSTGYGLELGSSQTEAYVASGSSQALLFKTNDTSERMRLTADGKLGVGTSSPDALTHIYSGASGVTNPHSYTKLHVESADHNAIQLSGSSGGEQWIWFADDTTATPVGGLTYYHGENYMGFRVNSAERARIDSSGNLRVAKTTSALADVGHELSNEGYAYHTRDGGTAMYINRKSSDGSIIDFYRDSYVGSIGIQSTGFYIDGESGHTGLRFGANTFIPRDNQADADNVVDLGAASARFDDVHATNGTIQTSDRNEKQDIAELTDAEKRVAVAAKGLMRKFRWKSAVTEKGEAARTHFGIIAQDLQAAFAAESLDAGDYAMFISSTWWETQTEVPAVEADEEKGIEAADAYTRTDTYNTEEEAPEGATKKTRLGVRYSELLAFIIGAL